MKTEYEIDDVLFQRSVVMDSDHAVVCSEPDNEDHEFCPWPYQEMDSVKPKFDTVAAAIMHVWSLESSQDRDCGDAQYGNGWHALFENERAILHTDNEGFVSAWRVEDGKDLDELWEEIEKGAVYPDSPDDDEESDSDW